MKTGDELEPLTREIFYILKNSKITIREAHSILRSVENELFGQIKDEREALYDKVIE